MPKLKPQTQFLLRGSTLLIALLSLWWFALRGPMTVVLRVAAGSFLQIEESDSGDWSLRVPLEVTLPAAPNRPVAQQIHSIDFDLTRFDVVTFTFSIPVFWAVMFAIPDWRRNLRAVGMGTAILAVVELLMLLGYAKVAAYKSLAQLAPDATSEWGRWGIKFGEYMLVSVLPYAVPLVGAFAVHPGFRSLVFSWGDPQSLKLPAKPGQKARRR